MLVPQSTTETRSRLPLPLATTNFCQSAGNRGYVLQLCNAIRLQADTMPPTEFLRTYLNSHEQWRNFVGILREATLEQQTPGLGFEVSILIDAVFDLKAGSSIVLLSQVQFVHFITRFSLPPVDKIMSKMQPIFPRPANVSCFRLLGARGPSVLLERTGESWKSTAPRRWRNRPWVRLLGVDVPSHTRCDSHPVYSGSCTECSWSIACLFAS